MDTGAVPLALLASDIPCETVDPSVLTPLLGHNSDDCLISGNQDLSDLSDAPSLRAPSPSVAAACPAPPEEPALRRSACGRSDAPKQPYPGGPIKPPKRKPKNT
ncbi:hypothetical protein DXG01_003621, partial [Tephrocybe rancida]